MEIQKKKKIKAKMDKDIVLIRDYIPSLINKIDSDILPVIIACSDENTDIVQINKLPKEKEILSTMFKDIGKFVAKTIKDLYGFILIYNEDEKNKIKIVVKDLYGFSRILLIDKIESSSTDSDTGWFDQETKADLFKTPGVDNLEDLWRSYRFNLIVK